MEYEPQPALMPKPMFSHSAIQYHRPWSLNRLILVLILAFVYPILAL